MSAQGVAISLFSGAGGLDLGVEATGYRVAAAVEMNDDAADTMEKNFRDLQCPVLRRDIMGVPTREFLRAAGLRGRERPDLLVGGPPCTPFSKSGFWLEWKRDGLDPDASLLQAYTRVLAEARPRAFVLENVYALTYRNQASGPAFARLLQEIDDAGYHCRWEVLNAADYGVPQLRPRLFVVGVPKRKPLPDLPMPSHSGRWERRVTGTGGLPHVTSGEVLAGMVTSAEPEETVRGKWGHLLEEIPPGENYLHFTSERGHPEPSFRLAEPLLVVPAEIGPGTAGTDHSGAAGSECRAVSLGEPPAPGPRAEAALHLSRRVRTRREPTVCTSTDWQLGAADAGSSSHRASGSHRRLTRVPEAWRQPFASSEVVRRRMSQLRRRDTGPELALRKELHRRGLRYFVHRRPLPSLRREADVLFPKAKVAVFVDGCFWHGCSQHCRRVQSTNGWYWDQKIESNRARDRNTDQELAAAGWVSLRIWEHDGLCESATRIEVAVTRRLRH